MAYPQVYPRTMVDAVDDSTPASLRSRASSIVTTTTKFSLETLSQDDRSSVGSRWERYRPSRTNRPRSMISMTSIARPAPPYNEAVDSTLLLPSHQNGDFQVQPRSPAGSAAEAISINEALPPSPARSGATTPSPDSPFDPDENPQAQVAYYSNVVRTLDQNYTAAIERLRQEHVQEIAATRHDIDQAYRAQWKVKNQQIERIREEAAMVRDEEIETLRALYEERFRDMEEKVSRLERELAEQKEGQAGAIEKARHEIEDLWEKRWSDRAHVEQQERARAEVARLAQLSGDLAEKDEGWVKLSRERDSNFAKVVRREILHRRHTMGNGTETYGGDPYGQLEKLLLALDTDKYDRKSSGWWKAESPAFNLL